MGGIEKITEYFEGIESEREYDPYFCSVAQALTIVIVGTFCGYTNLYKIHYWAKSQIVKTILKEHFGVQYIPSYYWLTCLMALIKPESLNECFNTWVESLVPEGLEGKTVAFDGKTICSTGKMEAFESALHVVSAQIAELGLTFAQETVGEKTNEIPTVQKLIRKLQLKGCIVVADALNCQKESAKAIIEQKAHYVLSVKDNQSTLKQDIKDFVQDEKLQQTMQSTQTIETARGRKETRTSYVSHDVEWLNLNHEWEKLLKFLLFLGIFIIKTTKILRENLSKWRKNF
ncbi:MAG: ISAs1 family transposase [Spirochaetales bacterium]